jgi:hypothetical protein
MFFKHMSSNKYDEKRVSYWWRINIQIKTVFRAYILLLKKVILDGTVALFLGQAHATPRWCTSRVLKNLVISSAKVKNSILCTWNLNSPTGGSAYGIPWKA